MMAENVARAIPKGHVTYLLSSKCARESTILSHWTKWFDVVVLDKATLSVSCGSTQSFIFLQMTRNEHSMVDIHPSVPVKRSTATDFAHFFESKLKSLESYEALKKEIVGVGGAAYSTGCQERRSVSEHVEASPTRHCAAFSTGCQGRRSVSEHVEPSPTKHAEEAERGNDAYRVGTVAATCAALSLYDDAAFYKQARCGLYLFSMTTAHDGEQDLCQLVLGSDQIANYRVLDSGDKLDVVEETSDKVKKWLPSWTQKTSRLNSW
jgi:hypothetical protein